MLFSMFIQTTNLTFGGLSNAIFLMNVWIAWQTGVQPTVGIFLGRETVRNVFVLDVETNLMPGVHSGMLLFDAYFRNIW